jgi:3-methyladenine DNA glycosylase/8-oxoguanine DNA glycosylase
MTSVTKLREIADVVHPVEPPFRFTTKVRKPSRFPTPLEIFDGDSRYLFMTEVAGKMIGCEIADDRGTSVRVRLHLAEGEDVQDADAVLREVERRLGLDADLHGLPDLWRADPLLSTLPRELLGGRPSAPHSLYAFLMLCVVLQNTSVRRRVQMMDALISRFAHQFEFPSGEILPGLWRPEELFDVPETELRELKLGYRAKTIRRLSDQFTGEPRLEQTLLEKAADEDLAVALGALYGVGPAASGYVMYAWFKRVDYLVHISPWERKILSRLIVGDEDHATEELIRLARARWSPYCMQAVHAIFESVFWRRMGGGGPTWLDELIRL